ncbi:MAG: hypothetical protein RIF32_04915 [Leptospirales bacterium]
METSLERLKPWTPAAEDGRLRASIKAVHVNAEVDPAHVAELAEILKDEGHPYPAVVGRDGVSIAGHEIIIAAHMLGWQWVWAVESEITPETLRRAWQVERSGLYVSIAPTPGRDQWAIKVVATRERSETISDVGPGPWEYVALESFRRAESNFMRRRPIPDDRARAGLRLKAKRESLGLLQEDAAELIEIKQNYWCDLEKGRATVRRIQEAYDALQRYALIVGAA